MHPNVIKKLGKVEKTRPQWGRWGWRMPALLAGYLLGVGAAQGFIEKIYPLQEVLKECTHIAVGHIEQVDQKGRTAVLVLERQLKGPLEYKKANLNIGVGPGPHVRFLMERLEPGAPAVLYYKQEGQAIASLVYVMGHWVQFFATDQPKQRDKVWWRFTHVELKMGRTFVGPTTNLVHLTQDVLAKRVAAPKPDPNVPPVDVDRVLASVASLPSGGKASGFFRQVRFPASEDIGVRGISFADPNLDGRLDLLLCRRNGNMLLVNQPGGFKEQGRELGLTDGVCAAAWADLDGDGRPDLLTAGFHLYRNTEGKLKEASAWLPDPGRPNAGGVGWMDANCDGWPDALLANGPDGLRLFENQGQGKGPFRDVSAASGFGTNGVGKEGGNFLALFDFDNDGRQDLFYNAQEGRLARQEDTGKFRLVEGSGLSLPGSASYKRGLAIADYNNDGNLDVLVPGPQGSGLFLNNNGTFTNVAGQAGDLAKIKGPSFSAAWGDVNNDGWQDLFLCMQDAPGQLLLNDGRGRFVNITKQAGLETVGSALAAAFGDLDNDGDLDLVLNLRDMAVIAFNDFPTTAGHCHLAVQIQARKGVTGATVRLLDNERRFVGLRDINGGSSCGGQGSPVAHFGIAAGQYILYAALSDGRLGRKPVDVNSTQRRNLILFQEQDFK